MAVELNSNFEGWFYFFYSEKKPQWYGHKRDLIGNLIDSLRIALMSKCSFFSCLSKESSPAWAWQRTSGGACCMRTSYKNGISLSVGGIWRGWTWAWHWVPDHLYNLKLWDQWAPWRNNSIRQQKGLPPKQSQQWQHYWVLEPPSAEGKDTFWNA